MTKAPTITDHERIRDYLTYVNLIDQFRPPEVMREVVTILHSEADFITRLKLLKDIDKDHLDDDIPETDESFTLDDRDFGHFAPERQNYPRFVLQERHHILNFGRRSKTIDTHTVGAVMDLSAKARAFWAVHFADVLDFYPIMRGALVNAWRIVDFKEYNRLVALNDYLEAVLEYGMGIPADFRLDRIRPYIETITPYFLRIIEDDLPAKKVLATLDDVFIGKPERRVVANLQAQFLRTLLSKSKIDLTMLNFLLATHMVIYRRFLTLGHLMDIYQPPPLESHRYVFPDQLKAVIQEYTTNIRQGFVENQQTLFMLQSIDRKVSLDTTGQPNLERLIERMIRHTSHPTLDSIDDLYLKRGDEARSVTVLSGSLSRLLAKLSTGFLAVYRAVLIDTIPLAGKATAIAIFGSSMFREPLRRLAALGQDLDSFSNLGVEGMIMSLDVYNTFQLTGKADSERAERFARLVDTLLATYKTIALRIANVLFMQFRYFFEHHEDREQKSSLTPINEFVNNPRRIPFHDVEIGEANTFHHGYTPTDVLNQILAVSINIPYIFGDIQIQNMLDKIPETVRKTDDMLETISRLYVH